MTSVKTSDLLKQVVKGNTSEIEGVKISKSDAQKLLKIYDTNLIDQKEFDKSPVEKIAHVLGNLGLDIKLENIRPSKKLTIEQKNKIKSILRENI